MRNEVKNIFWANKSRGSQLKSLIWHLRRGMWRVSPGASVSVSIPACFCSSSSVPNAVVTGSGRLAIKNFANLLASGCICFFVCVYLVYINFYMYFVHMEGLLELPGERNSECRNSRVISISAWQIAKLKLNVTEKTRNANGNTNAYRMGASKELLSAGIMK